MSSLPVKVTPFREVLNAIQSANPDAPISAMIPEHFGATDILRWIRGCGEVIQKTEETRDKVTFLLGILMQRANRDEAVRVAAGCENMEQFVSYLEGISGKKRATIYNEYKAVQAFPDENLRTYSEIGVTKLILASQYYNPGSGDKSKFLEKARLPRPKFEDWIAASGYANSKGEMHRSGFVLSGNNSQLKELKDFLGNLNVQQHVGSSDPLQIILALTQENSNWADDV